MSRWKSPTSTSRNAIAGDRPYALSYSLSGESDSSKNVFARAQLVSYGMLDVTLFSDDGDELNIDSDSPVSISMPISNGDLPPIYAMADGATQSTWSFNPKEHRWVEEGEGVVREDEEGNLSFEFEASHFSWWNCDKGMVPTCASGRVIDMLGFPVRGATVTCAGNSRPHRPPPTKTDTTCAPCWPVTG